MEAVRLTQGGGCLSESIEALSANSGAGMEMKAGARAKSGAELLVFDVRRGLASGMVFLQHSSDFAVGPHLPLRQQSIAW